MTNDQTPNKVNESKPALFSKVILTNLVSLAVAWATFKGFNVPPEMQAEITMAILTVANTLSMVFRFFTSKAVYIKKPKT